jgi:hypothetical protein
MIPLGFSFILSLPHENPRPPEEQEDRIKEWIAYYERRLDEVWENLATTVASSREFPSHEQYIIVLKAHMAAYRREMQVGLRTYLPPESTLN